MRKWTAVAWILVAFVLYLLFFRARGVGAVSSNMTPGAGAPAPGSWLSRTWDSLTGRTPAPTLGPSYMTQRPGQAQAGAGPASTSVPFQIGAGVAAAAPFFQTLGQWLSPAPQSGAVAGGSPTGAPYADSAWWAPTQAGAVDQGSTWPVDIFAGGDISTVGQAPVMFGPGYAADPAAMPILLADTSDPSAQWFTF